MRGTDEDALRITLQYLEGTGAYDRLPEPAQKQLLDDLPEWRALTTSRDAFLLLRPDEVARIDKPVLLLTGANTLKIFAFIDDELQSRITEGATRGHRAGETQDVGRQRGSMSARYARVPDAATPCRGRQQTLNAQPTLAKATADVGAVSCSNPVS